MPIVGTLPFDIVNGTLANADEVMADLQFIADQVDANAQPAGGGAADTIAWTLMPTAPTFVSTTSFTMTGDQTASFTIGRRLKSTNTGGTVYSTVIAAVAVLNTTITVTNQSGTLDSGMSDVAISTIDPTNPALPVFTDLYGASVTAIVSASLTIMRAVDPVAGDVLSEFTLGTSSFFTPKTAGTYIVGLAGALLSSGDNVTALATPSAFIYKNTVIGDVIQNLTWPFGSGVQSNTVTFTGSAKVSAAAGDLIQIKFSGNTWSGGGFRFVGNYSFRRLVYP